MARFIVLVVDSFGVGYMDDVLQVRARDYGANTCRHILDRIPDLYLPCFEKLGLMNALGYDYKKMKINWKDLKTRSFTTAFIRHRKDAYPV